MESIDRDQSRLAVFFILLILIVAYSLSYQSAWQWGVIDNFLLLERLKDPNFILNDFFTNTQAGAYSPRSFIAYFYLYGEKVFGCTYEKFVAWANIIRLVLVELGIFYLAKSLTRSFWIASVAVFLGLVSFHLTPPVPGWFFQSPDLTGQSLALPFSLFSLGFYFSRKYFLSALMCILTILIHPLMGLYLFPLYFLAEFSGSKKDFKKKISKEKIWWMFVPVIVFVVNAFIFKIASGGGEPLSTREYIDIVIKFRHPHHHLASSFSFASWVYRISFIVCFITASFLVRKRLDKYRYFVLVGGYALLICFMAWFFVEVVPIKYIAMLGPFRSFTYFFPLFSIVMAVLLVDQWERRKFVPAIFIILGFSINNHHLRFSFICLFLGILACTPFSQFEFREKLENGFTSIVNKYRAFPIILTGVLSCWLLMRSIGSFHFNIPDKRTDTDGLYSWLRAHTEKDAIIWGATDQAKDGVFDQKVRLFAKRAVVVGDDFPFLDKYIKQWYRRYLDIVGEVISAPGKLTFLEEKQIFELARKYQVNYILTHRNFSEAGNMNLRAEKMINDVVIYLYKIDQTGGKYDNN